MAKKKSLLSELRAAERKHGQFESLDLLIPDLSGILRGKRVRRREFDKVTRDGFVFCAGTTLLNSLGEVTSGVPYGADDGDPDLPARMVPASIVPVPWAGKPMGQAFFRIDDADGSPFFADPRTVLENALRPFAKRGIRPVVATELEFYLLDGRRENIVAGTPKVPGTDRVQPGAQVYLPDDLFEVEGFLDDVYDWCALQNVPAEAAISEYSPGQFEINLHHIGDAVLACDHAVMLKRIIKAAARKHGFIACFMAKPFEEDAGNGLHIHMSLVDKDGRNYFSQGKEKMALPPFSARLRHAVGGLLKLMPESTAIFAPNANSYRRLRPDMFAPVEPNWGVNHRVVSVRVPESDENNLRFEHRVAGADANPYLVMAAVVAGAHYGIKNRIDPGRMVQQGEAIVPKLRIPNRWDQALDRFARSKVLREYLGEDYCRYYTMVRRAESARFHNAVAPLDFDWYLRSV
ncbi:MAG: glutamine synthetase family protein [Gammaproteobacteria bacterium]|nr:glutamine synthetase family protein [Gammaproteobacteria bacterium]MBT8094860.1 glutamine synthetase family protein [Gammaproteobacteria bacterium]MBT8105961.1 glutamine synthetase family protein [Gammaproteobacteria bacterium]NNF48454.1 glutamine synthetase [Woeseiaceae bacterium]NNK25975.1 glutamine synthetase [Woeseiaceae bacterium]